MTVQQLIEELQAAIDDESVKPDAEIYIARETHDHWRSVKAEPLTSIDLFANVRHSSYHDALVLVDETDETDAFVTILR